MSQRSANHHFSIHLLQVIDAVLVWLAFSLAELFRGPFRSMLGLDEGGSIDLQGMMSITIVVVSLTPLVMEKFGHYYRLVSRSGLQIFTILFRGMLLIGFVIGAVVTFAKVEGTSRLIIGSGFLITYVFLWARAYLTTRLLRRQAKDEGLLETVVLAGSREETEAFLTELDPGTSDLWRIADHFDLAVRKIDELDALIKAESVQRVVFLSGHTEFERVARAVETCEVQGVEAWIGASFLKTQVARPSFDVVGGQPMLVFRSTPELSWQLFGKKVVDITGATALLLLSSPFWIAAIIGIRLSSPGAPVIFTQQRSGLYGKPFRIFKFRTMVADAEKLLEQVKEEHGNEVDGPAFKLKTDPRIFPFGNFLRKYSIDELPQVINVLRGEMSLVGPRPLPLHEIEAIADSAHRRRLSMKPGITCLWQISGRSDITDFNEWVKLDVEYIDRWSIWEDFRILLKTIPAVLFSKGAR